MPTTDIAHDVLDAHAAHPVLDTGNIFDASNSPKPKNPEQQTFEFWQPEPAATAAKPKRPVPTKPPVASQRRLKRTQRWANMTVATLRQGHSSLTDRSQSERSAKSDSTLPGSPASPSTALPRQSGQPTRQSLMADLRNRAAAISTSPAMDTAHVFSTGSKTLDTWFPSGGLKRGQICEWVATGDAGGAGTLSMITAAAAIADQSGPVIVVDPCETFHAAAAIACGIAPDRIVWCRSNNRRDSVWALDQALRCPAVAAVWATLPWRLNDRDARRLQLAAEIGRTPGLFVLSASEASRPSFAPVRFHVDPIIASQSNSSGSMAAFSRPPVDVRTVRVRMNEKRQAILAITPDARLHTIAPETRSTETRHETAAVSLAARLAHPASARRNAPHRKTG